VADRQDKIPITDLELLALTLEHNLPFSFVDSPRLRAVADISCGRKRLSECTTTVHERMVAKLKSEFLSVREFAIVLDECGVDGSQKYRVSHLKCNISPDHQSFHILLDASHSLCGALPNSVSRSRIRQTETWL
jgi:hypothetical protein